MALQSQLQSSSACFSGTCWFLSALVFPHQAQPPQIAHKFLQNDCGRDTRWLHKGPVCPDSPSGYFKAKEDSAHPRLPAQDGRFGGAAWPWGSRWGRDIAVPCSCQPGPAHAPTHALVISCTRAHVPRETPGMVPARSSSQDTGWKGPQRSRRALGTADSTSDWRDELPEPTAAFGRAKSPARPLCLELWQHAGHSAFPTVLPRTTMGHWLHPLSTALH